jgi:hypothetical protein
MEIFCFLIPATYKFYCTVVTAGEGDGMNIVPLLSATGLLALGVVIGEYNPQ